MDNMNRLKSADQLNDDGVVFLICTIFGWYTGWDQIPQQGDTDTMTRLFAGGCKTGNSHNGSYQCALNMSRLALHKYAPWI